MKGKLRQVCWLVSWLVIFITPTLAAMTDDSLVIGGGARPIGMGKAFVALADDADGMFVNPAGLASLKAPQAMAMFTNLLGEVYYTEFCGVIPANFGAVGVGYINTGISGIRIEVNSREVTTDYYDSLLTFDYSSALNRFFQYAENVSVGGTLKIYNRGYTGGYINTATGFSADLGIKYVATPYVSFGFCRQNILPVSLGSVIRQNSGAEEALAGIAKAGTVIKPIFWKGQVAFLFDTDLPAQSGRPITSHFGVEWKVAGGFTVRAGLDQNIDGTVSTKTYWNPTFGTSISLAGLRVDYAYHSYYNQPGLATNYVSLSYTGEPWFALKGRAE